MELAGGGGRRQGNPLLDLSRRSHGREATGYGLVDRDGSETERVVEAAEDNRLIQAHWDILKDYVPNPRWPC